MVPVHSAVFVDLDRTLLRSASGPVLQRALVGEGVLSSSPRLPGDRLLYQFYDCVGETVPFIALARAAARVMRGRSVPDTRRAGKAAVAHLMDLVQPYALEALAKHQRAGRRLVLATTSPARSGRSAGRQPRVRRCDRYPVPGRRRSLYRSAGRTVRMGPGKARCSASVGAGARCRPGHQPCVLGQRVRPPVADGCRSPTPAQRRPPAGGCGDSPSVAARVLGPSARGPVHTRTGAVRPDPPLRPPRELSLRSLRHRWARTCPAFWTGAACFQPSQLLRRCRAGPGRRPDGSTRTVHGQARAVRRAGDRPVGTCHRWHSRRSDSASRGADA